MSDYKERRNLKLKLNSNSVQRLTQKVKLFLGVIKQTAHQYSPVAVYRIFWRVLGGRLQDDGKELL